MSKKISFLSAAVSIILVSPLFAAQVNSTWVGGSSGDWETPTNWNPPIVPDNNLTDSFNVMIDGTSASVSISMSQFHDIDSLAIAGPVAVGATPNLQVDGNLTVPDGATLRISRGTVGVKPGLLDITGSITLAPWTELWADPCISNTGFVQLLGARFGSDSVFHNRTTGCITGFGFLYGFSSLRNDGQIIATSGALSVASSVPMLSSGLLANRPTAALNVLNLADQDGTVINQGIVEANTGGGVTFEFNLVNEPNATIKLLGGTLAATKITQKADANFRGFGGITGNVQIEPNAIIKLTGPTNVVGDVNIPAGATLEISDGQTLITGHTTCKGTIYLKGGTVIFQGGCDCENCNIINEAGLDRNHFDINADGAVKLDDFASFAQSWLWQASWY